MSMKTFFELILHQVGMVNALYPGLEENLWSVTVNEHTKILTPLHMGVT